VVLVGAPLTKRPDPALRQSVRWSCLRREGRLDFRVKSAGTLLLTKATRACAYDRAGVGFSDPSGRPSSPANIVDDLHHLLASAGIPPPYILVGHSYGGMGTILFADRFVSEVTGVVLVDPALEGQVRTIEKYFPRYDKSFFEPAVRLRQQCLQEAELGFVPGTSLYRQCVSETGAVDAESPDPLLGKIYSSKSYQATALSELVNVCQIPYLMRLPPFIDETVPSLMRLEGRNWSQHRAR
jgi:pimeloyl-ACP methyl ester carboxylesterase